MVQSLCHLIFKEQHHLKIILIIKQFSFNSNEEKQREKIAQIRSETEKNKSETEKNESETRINHMKIWLILAAVAVVAVLAIMGNLDKIPKFWEWWQPLLDVS